MLPDERTADVEDGGIREGVAWDCGKEADFVSSLWTTARFDVDGRGSAGGNVEDGEADSSRWARAEESWGPWADN